MPVTRVLFPFVFGAALLSAAVQWDAGRKTWILTSGPAEYRLRQDAETLVLDAFGPAGKAQWPEPNPPGALRPEFSASVEGMVLEDSDWHLSGQPAAGEDELRLTLRHTRAPLEVAAVYKTYGDTGVFSRQLTVINTGSAPVRLLRMPSLNWALPGADYRLSYLHGPWGKERQLSTEMLSPGRRSFISRRGRSSALYSPWFDMHDERRGLHYMAQLAWSGNWEMHFEREAVHHGRRGKPDVSPDVLAEIGLHNDFGGAVTLAPGQKFLLPMAAFTVAAGDLDDAANQLHRYQRRYVIPRTGINRPLVTQFNSWYPFKAVFTEEQLRYGVDVAARLGLDSFVIDDGWFPRDEKGVQLFGDWEADPKIFPRGMKAFADYVHGKGLKFGLWVEIELGAFGSRIYREHPDWFLSYRGERIVSRRGPYLNYGKPEVRAWALGAIRRLADEYKVDWIKFDYNIEYGERFDSSDGAVLYRHVMGIYDFFDGVRAAHPNVLIENCSSGGLRIDLGMIARSHTSWLSDNVDPKNSVQLAYGCTVEFTPEVCNHWMVGDKSGGETDMKTAPGWWDFLFRVPMNGQFGISSRVADWSPEFTARAAANVALYKRIRDVFVNADAYHLTEPPAHDNPSGWMAIEYVAEDKRRAVVTAYRLSASASSVIVRLRGLEPGARYRVSVDGKPANITVGAGEALPLSLDAEWRAVIVELDAAN